MESSEAYADTTALAAFFELITANLPICELRANTHNTTANAEKANAIATSP
ncbi:MAG: hypothetical protein ACP5MC_01080 [Candidatus Micrarchaeia archaeon]